MVVFSRIGFTAFASALMLSLSTFAKEKAEVYQATDTSDAEMPAEGLEVRPPLPVVTTTVPVIKAHETAAPKKSKKAKAAKKKAPAAPTLTKRIEKLEQELMELRAKNAGAPTTTYISASATQDGIASPPYDPVPQDQTDGIAKRLKLVELLIRKHQRAYDYRTHTVKDLELILAELERAPKSASETGSSRKLPPPPTNIQVSITTESDEPVAPVPANAVGPSLGL